MASTSPPMSNVSVDKKCWWLRNKKVVDKYMSVARTLAATKEHSNVAKAVGILDAALALSPRMEAALELKARSLLFLRRFRDVADMLQDYIPSYRIGVRDEDSTTTSTTSTGSSSDLSRECIKLLSPGRERSGEANWGDESSFLCFSVLELKRRVMSGLSRNAGSREGHWRYFVLGHACSHLGLMEDAMALLQTGRRLATDAFRRQSNCLSDDSFAPSTTSELDTASQLLSQIKLILRRRAAAIAAIDAGLPSESIRHFTKILENCRNIPSSFASSCLIGRASAYRAAGRFAEAIADCNRALAIDPSSIMALCARADLLESVGAMSECLRDLDHLKLLYNAILRDGKLLGPQWRPQTDVRFCDIPRCLSDVIKRARKIRGRIAAGEGFSVDYYKVIGVERGCTRSELERAHLVLTLRHKPEKAAGFLDRLEFADDFRDLDAVHHQAKMSALILYRMLQKGYSSIMPDVMEKEAVQRLRAKEAAAAAAAASVVVQPVVVPLEKAKVEKKLSSKKCGLETEKAAVAAVAVAAAASVFRGVFCRDMAIVGGMLAHRAIPLKYQAMSC